MTDSDQLVQYPIPPVDAIEPPPEWERLRQQCPVAHVQLPSGDEAALLTRYDANAGFGMIRYVTEELELSDGVLPAGTTTVCSMASANRDERVFADAAEMDLSRSPNVHLAFGAGPHSCIGQSLARTELQVVLEVLLRRLPTLALAVPSAELPLVEGLLVGGLREVRVIW